MNFLLRILIVLCCFYCCTNKKSKQINVSNIEVDFNVDRFDVDFYSATENSLPALKDKYPFLFPKDITDSIAIAKIKSKDEQDLYKETQKVYNNFSSVNKQLTSLFKHIKYSKPSFKSPRVITMLTNIDYNSRVIYADSLLIISLDVFLGKNHPFYTDFPAYIKENNTKEHLIVDVATAIIDSQLQPKQDRTFINKMIFEGKKMYLLESFLPNISNVEIFGTTKEKYDWLVFNEEPIWSYFIQKDLLFSTDTSLNSRFLEKAPFSKFYMEQDNLSPGKAGVWIGWQIVRSYMKHNNVSLQKLLRISETDLYTKSKYKPRK